MAGNKDLFQWFCAVSNWEDSLQSLVKIKPQSRKKMPYKGLLWLISFLVYFLLRMIQLATWLCQLATSPSLHLMLTKVVTMRTRPKHRIDAVSVACLLLSRFPDGSGFFPQELLTPIPRNPTHLFGFHKKEQSTYLHLLQEMKGNKGSLSIPSLILHLFHISTHMLWLWSSKYTLVTEKLIIILKSQNV